MEYKRSRKLMHDCSYDYRRRLDSRLRTRRVQESVSSIPEMSNLTSESHDDNEHLEMGESSTANENSIVEEFHIDHDSISNDVDNSLNDSDSDSSECSNDSESFKIDTFDNFKSMLAESFINVNMTHVQVNAMLNVLRTHSCFASLPKDSRKVLNTPRSTCPIQVLENDNELYLHFGLESAIADILENTPINLIPDNIEIDFNTDGATLDRSGKIQMWPIQIRISNIKDSKPEIVGIFQGSHKPSNAHTFIRPFIDDVKKITAEGGILYNKKRISIVIRCFIGDAPARAFLLGHAAHNSSFPCSKCTVQGNCIRRGVMVYSGVGHLLRTAERYKNRIDGDHHTEGESPLNDLNLDLVSQAPFEYMHLVCIGVMEKILTGIIDGKFCENIKLSSSNIKLLNSRLNLITNFCPTNFARKPASFDKHQKFKATELRQILLYSGPVIFLGLMNKVAYLHFMLFHNAIRILASSTIIDDYLSYAEEALKKFVLRAESIYGQEFLTYNVHGLLHIVNDVKLFGPLDSFSAFPYENNMQYLRKTCKKPQQFLQQIANRREERKHHKTVIIPENRVKVFSPHNNGPLTAPIENITLQWRKIKFGECFLALNGRDDTVFRKNSTICVIKNIITVNNEYHLIVGTFLEVSDFCNFGMESASLGVFHCSALSEELDIISLDDVDFKCFRMPYWDPDRLPTSNEPVPHEYIVVKLLNEKIEA